MGWKWVVVLRQKLRYNEKKKKSSSPPPPSKDFESVPVPVMSAACNPFPSYPASCQESLHSVIFGPEKTSGKGKRDRVVLSVSFC